MHLCRRKLCRTRADRHDTWLASGANDALSPDVTRQSRSMTRMGLKRDRHHMLAMSFSTLSSTERNGSLHKTVR